MNWQTNSKTIHFKTFGCKVNQYETQVLRELFLKVGFYENSRSSSDIYIVNTCSLTKNTDRKVRQYIKEVKRLNPKAKIFVGGCGVFNPESGLEGIKGIEIFKSKDKRGLFKRVVGIEDYLIDPICSFQGHERAFVKIQDGCDNLCSYCVIPYLRGGPASRPKDEILTEIKNLVDNQFKEIVICGINLGAYGINQNGNLIDLIRQILSIKKNFRLRLSSIEPNYVSQELINLMAGNERLCPHFHLPLQSGDDEILKIMNRKYSVKEYFSLIDNIRKKVKDVSITSDILVGFPGETEKNFKNTLKAIEKVRFLKTHIFSYSRRQLTPSAKLEGQLSAKTINERRKEAQEVAQKNSYLFRKSFINRTLPVLIEKRRNKETLRNFGFTNNYIEVQLEASDDLVNSIRDVKIIAVKMHENFAILSPKG